MALVHKEPVNAQLLKGHNIVLAALVIELFQLEFNALFGFLKLFN